MRERPLVLVVDDDENFLEMVQDILASRKIDSVTASNGPEGIERAREVRPDLILLDVMMPGLDGYETCALLKMHPDLKGIPVLMLTAGDPVKFNELGFKAGAAFCLPKPFETRRFLSLVELGLSQAPVLPPRPEAEPNRRAFRRYYAPRYPVLVRAAGETVEKREVRGVTANIGAGGLFCTLPERFPVLTPLLLQVESPAGQITLAAIVAWCGSASAHRAGVVPHGLRILRARTPDDAARWGKVLKLLEAAETRQREGQA